MTSSSLSSCSGNRQSYAELKFKKIKSPKFKYIKFQIEIKHYPGVSNLNLWAVFEI